MIITLDADGCIMVDGEYPTGTILQRFSSHDDTEETLTANHSKRFTLPLNTKRAASTVEINYTVNFAVAGGPETNAPIGEAAIYIDSAKVHSAGFEIECISSSVDEKGRGCATGHIMVPAWTGTKDIELRAVYVSGDKPLVVLGHSITIKEIR